MRLDGHSYSPTVLAQILEVAGRLPSSEQAAIALQVGVGLDISGRHVSRLIREIGTELAQVRDAKTRKRRRRQTAANRPTPTVVAVEVDGGRLWTRQAGAGPGVHDAQAKEDKIACLQSLQSSTHAEDPHPEPPASFLDAPRVVRLVHRVKRQAAEASTAGEPATAEPDGTPEATATGSGRTQPLPQPEPWAGAPERLVRTCVATLQKSKAFGPMVAGEAYARGFYEAQRRAFVGDGQAYNWTIQRVYFPDFVPIVDFIHVLCYLYLAAWAVGGDEETCWKRYQDWLRWCWQGQVGSVIEALGSEYERLGRPPPEAPAADPRRVIAETLTYLSNNRGRMDYPAYRRAGLPVTSSLVESLVGEFNARVKGKDKHWDRPEGAEAILQVRAAVLSEDERLERFFAERPGNPYRRRRSA